MYRYALADVLAERELESRKQQQEEELERQQCQQQRGQGSSSSTAAPTEPSAAPASASELSGVETAGRSVSGGRRSASALLRSRAEELRDVKALLRSVSLLDHMTKSEVQVIALQVTFTSEFVILIQNSSVNYRGECDFSVEDAEIMWNCP